MGHMKVEYARVSGCLRRIAVSLGPWDPSVGWAGETGTIPSADNPSVHPYSSNAANRYDADTRCM